MELMNSNDWDLSLYVSGFNFENIYADIFLRFNYFNNSFSNDNFFYEKNNSIQLNTKFSSKNLSDYYKGFSIIKEGLYKNYLIDPSSLHVWDSTFENDSNVLNLREKIFSNLEAKTNYNKICLPIKFENSIYCYIEIGKYQTPSFNNVQNFIDSSNSAKIFETLCLTYPKFNINFINCPWHERHFPIYINTDFCKNYSDADLAKLIYFYYQRQNPYLQKKYILSYNSDLFCDFSFGNFEELQICKNKYGVFYYGPANFDCSLISNASINGLYTGLNYSVEFIGDIDSSIESRQYNFNNIYTSIDKNSYVFDFQQCAFANCLDFLYCKNNFFAFCDSYNKNFANVWFRDTNNFNQQFNGLPNLNVFSEDNIDPLISSDFFNTIKCINVIL